MADKEYEEIGRAIVTDGRPSIPLEVSSAMSVGSYELLAEYQENNSYMGSSATAKLIVGFPVSVYAPTVYTWSNHLDLTKFKAYAYVGDQQVTYGKIAFTQGGTTLTEEVDVTGGKVEIPYDLSSNSMVDTNSLTAVFSKGVSEDTNKYYFLPATSNEFNIEIIDYDDYSENLNYGVIDVYPVTSSPNSDVTITAIVDNVSTGESFPLDGTVTFTVNDVSASTTIGDGGVAQVTISVGDWDGAYPIHVEYSGNSTWNPCMGEGVLFASNYHPDLNQPIATSSNFSVNMGEGLSVVVNMTDRDGQPLTAGSGQLLVDSVLVDCDNDDENNWVSLDSTTGQLTFTLATIPSTFEYGTHTISIVYKAADGEQYTYSGVCSMIIRRPTKVTITNAVYNTINLRDEVYVDSSQDQGRLNVQVDNIENVNNPRSVTTGRVIAYYK